MKRKKRNKSTCCKGRPSSTNASPRPPLVDAGPLHVPPDRKTNKSTQEPQISSPTLLKKYVMLYNDDNEELCEKIDLWDYV